jgi:hypothetical protein
MNLEKKVRNYINLIIIWFTLDSLLITENVTSAVEASFYRNGSIN